MSRKISEITLRILDCLADGLDAVYAAKYHRGALLRGGLGAVRRVQAARARSEVRRRLQALKRAGIVKTRKQGNLMTWALTEKGIGLHLRSAMLRSKPLADGRGILAMFDVPEAAKDARDHLRRFLKSAGFTKLQHSVWITDRDVRPYLKDWRHIDASGKWVSIFEGKKLL